MDVVGAANGHKRGRLRDKDDDDEAEQQSEAKRTQQQLPWVHQPPASRIYRVSRASGGKDRHSKVYTAKGIRDRRVRLSVSTAIQFYDLQDRLGYDQPSKAIEWLIKAAAAAIDKLPSLDATDFPSHPASAPAAANNDTNKADDADAHADGSQSQLLLQQQLTKSGCSSTSETSKGSVLSLSRSENRVKARERARERSAAARDKDKEHGDDAATTRRAATASSQAASFTELLTGMAVASAAPAGAAEHKQQQQQTWQPMTVAAATADYIGFAAQPRKAGHAMPDTFTSPAPRLGNITPIAMAPSQHFSLTAGVAAEPHADMTQFSFLQDHFMPVHAAAASGPAGDYNLNFSMSSGLVGVHSRGTLQSNSQSHLSSHHHHHQQQQLQRLSTPLDAPSNIPFLFSPSAAPTAAESQFAAAAALHLWDGFRHADMKDKGKH
ncbi:hypothetical protein ABZP36_000493 [Zizania latifolia]